MMNVILFDDDHWKSLLPLCFTRPISDLRVGILTIKQKWEMRLACRASYITQDYLSEKYPIQIGKDNLIINAGLLPNSRMVKLISQLENKEAILFEDELIAARLDERQFLRLTNNQPMDELRGIDIKNDASYLDRILKLEDIFLKLEKELEKDFALLTKGRDSAKISDTNEVFGKHKIFMEEGARMEYSTINTEAGSVYLDKDCEIMEGSHIRAGLYLGEKSILKMGSRIYGPCSFGPECKLGGEIKNSVVLGHSNKAHDGFLGNSVIGEWCNLGADTNSSNMKNNYNTINIWDYTREEYRDSQMNFLGLIMGDHSKCGINTMFNSGTVVGVFANLYGSGYPRKFIPSFSWGSPKNMETYDLEKATELAARFGDQSKDEEALDKKILEFIYHKTSKFRKWEFD